MQICTTRRRCVDPVLIRSSPGFTVASTSIGIKQQPGPLFIKRSDMLCQISERYDHDNIQSHGFESSRDLTVRRLTV